MCFLRERAHLTQRDLAAQPDYHYSYIAVSKKPAHACHIHTYGQVISALDIDDEPQSTAASWHSPLENLQKKRHSQPKDRPTIPDGTICFHRPASRPCSGHKEFKQVIETLLKDDVRILTIVGPPGVEKTRWLCILPKNWRISFPMGQYLSTLHPFHISPWYSPRSPKHLAFRKRLVHPSRSCSKPFCMP